MGSFPRHYNLFRLGFRFFGLEMRIPFDIPIAAYQVSGEFAMLKVDPHLFRKRSGGEARLR